jgi:hypothetical protein
MKTPYFAFFSPVFALCWLLGCTSPKSQDGSVKVESIVSQYCDCIAQEPVFDTENAAALKQKCLQNSYEVSIKDLPAEQRQAALKAFIEQIQDCETQAFGAPLSDLDPS